MINAVVARFLIEAALELACGVASRIGDLVSIRACRLKGSLRAFERHFSAEQDPHGLMRSERRALLTRGGCKFCRSTDARIRTKAARVDVVGQAASSVVVRVSRGATIRLRIPLRVHEWHTFAE